LLVTGAMGALELFETNDELRKLQAFTFGSMTDFRVVFHEFGKSMKSFSPVAN